MKENILKMRKLLMSRQFVRFFIVGVSATLIDLSFLISMVYVLNFSPFFVVSFSVLDFPFNIDISVANSISAFITIAYSFFLQRSWAFNANGGEMRHQLYRYILVVGFTYLYTNILFGFLVVNHGITEGISKVFVTAVQMVISYLLYKLVVFKQRSS